MASDDNQLSGPDLARGIDADELADGAMLAGHAQGEAVLIARCGDEVFALDATCTHYGGPLADGLMVGDTVRCPWHYARFSLWTGVVMRAPALVSIGRWETERRGDRFFVVGKSKPAAAFPREVPADIKSVVILGGGAGAGTTHERG